MFTGIAEEMGIVRAAAPGRLVIGASVVLGDMKLGDSVAVSGACLTVVGQDRATFTAEVAPETTRRTHLGSRRPGDYVNLERPLAATGRFGGHFVQGHVDATGRFLSATPEGEALLARYGAPPSVMRYIVEKGFIAVDGVSLTVTTYDATSFTVSLIPYTRRNTTLGRLRPGDAVNLEVDIVAKYLERFQASPVSQYGASPAPQQEAGPGVSWESLAEHGFITR
ncbi:MAG: riboflavin synthase [Chloroflexota bacterium]|nr:riboflavin synthase [Chloroflexota bacterium]